MCAEQKDSTDICSYCNRHKSDHGWNCPSGVGPQKGPASVLQLLAQVKQNNRELEETHISLEDVPTYIYGLRAEIARLRAALREAREYHVFCQQRMGKCTQGNVWLYAEHDDQMEAIDEALK